MGISCDYTDACFELSTILFINEKHLVRINSSSEWRFVFSDLFNTMYQGTPIFVSR